jgi:hypothetical protein
MGKVTAASRNLQVNFWPDNNNSTSLSPQQAIGCPPGPDRRGPTAGAVEVKGRMENEAPESTRKRLEEV